MENENVNLTLPIKVSYEVLQQLTDKKLIGMEIGTGSRKQGRIIGTSLAASPLQEVDIVLGLQISIASQILLPKKATIFIHGSMDFDSETGRLSVGIFKIDAKSKNFLLDKALEIFANRIYYRKVLDKATYNLNKLIRSHLTKLNERLESGMPLSLGMVLQGNLKNITITRIEPLTDNFGSDTLQECRGGGHTRNSGFGFRRLKLKKLTLFVFRILFYCGPSQSSALLGASKKSR